MKKIILILLLLISTSIMAQEVIHSIPLTNKDSGEEMTLEIIELGDDYFFKSSDQEVFPNKVVDNYEYRDIINALLEAEWISPEVYMSLKEYPEAKRRSADAIMGGFSDGDDNQAGDKGKVTGDPYASGYYGNGGSGSGGNYRLSNRNALNRPKPDYPCNEEGKVVVTIYVDQSGNVVDVEAGAKGTTNSAPCLLNEAKEAALKTKFNKDAKAPPRQQGAVIYNFSLSE